MNIDSANLPPDFLKAMERAPALRMPDMKAVPNPECDCRACNPKAWWMILCDICGNKRCPHAENHENACSGSNAVGPISKPANAAPSSQASASEATPEPPLPPKRATGPPESKNGVRFTIPGDPVGKPRQTQRDKWAKRPCVMRYREWADKARTCAEGCGGVRRGASEIVVWAYFELPKSWSREKRRELTGKPHRQRPDADNCLKSAMDALFTEDSGIFSARVIKTWEDGSGPRVEVEIR